ncbi:MAG: hypothetical protein FWH44_00015 [Methanomassiliicoccaceae archaeon]|nr:hypothetical protein [Methanomassiliicoccaceae archaeon]
MMSEGKKRRVKLSALLGAVSGAIFAAILYFVMQPTLWYFLLVPVAAAMAAGQAYLTPE